MREWLMQASSDDITAVILAGGLGRRMRGRDKGLLPMDGVPLVARIHAAIAPQVGAVLINANRNLADYAVIGPPVVEDVVGGYPGPLAGVLTGLEHCRTPLLLTLPCDTPGIAPLLASRMAGAMRQARADVAVAHDGERLQPVFALLRRDAVLPGLRAAIVSGQRRLEDWISAQNPVLVDFSDARGCFENLNTPEDYARACGLPSSQ
jgi:molybdenum cofactor guanylyltransferase